MLYLSYFLHMVLCGRCQLVSKMKFFIPTRKRIIISLILLILLIVVIIVSPIIVIYLYSIPNVLDSILFIPRLFWKPEIDFFTSFNPVLYYSFVIFVLVIDLFVLSLSLYLLAILK